MARTAQQLRDRALRKLNVVGSGQSASGEDGKLADDIIEEMFSDYQNHFQFTSAAIPDWAFESIVSMAAARMSPMFDFAPVAMSERDALAMYSAARERQIDKLLQPMDLGFY